MWMEVGRKYQNIPNLEDHQRVEDESAALDRLREEEDAAEHSTWVFEKNLRKCIQIIP
jgi:hypothetical protein